jgi:hypothetical protein
MNLPVWARPAIAGAVLLGASGLGYAYLYAVPRNAIQGKLEAAQQLNAAYETELKDHKRVKDRLKAIAATTLAATPGQADARFRSALNDLAVGNGLTKVTVNTRGAADEANPAGSAPKFQTALRGDLKRQKDFAVIGGDVEGHGTLQQVLKTASMVQAQPWVHRVDNFSVRPEGNDRERFVLKMGVATILMPADLAPKDAPEPQIDPANDAAAKQWASIVEKNVFKEPSPPVAAAPSQPQPAPGPSTPPYDEWKLTGVVESRLGVEAFLVNVKNGQRLTLPVGSAVADARFVSGAGELAVFEIAGQKFEVSNGQTLEQRRLVSR